MRAGPELLEEGRLNPGYLKLDLFCRGLRLADDCVLPGGGDTRRVRAGLGSGLDLAIPGADGMLVNAPVLEAFAAASPYTLHGPQADGAYAIQHDGRAIARVRVPQRPRFEDLLTAGGKRMGSVGALQGTYLGVYYGPLCANWKRPDTDACRFCALGLNVGAGEERTDKQVADVVETALAAQAERGVTFVHINGGFDDRGQYLERYGPLVLALRERTGLLIGLQIPPLDDLSGYATFKRLGVDNISLCFEVWNEARFHAVCPGKDARAGRAAYLAAIEHCALRVRFGTTNGELIAGLEAAGEARAAVDWLTTVGAVPTVCVFRPLAGTALAARLPPPAAEVAPLLAHAYRRCMQRGLPLGVAPNVKVSIVMNPEEGRWLLPPAERRRWPLRRMQHAALRRVLSWHVRRRVRRARAAAAGGRV